MRVVVIGGTGHIGTYLIPRLVEAGHGVICISRQQRRPYTGGSAWDAVQQVELDRLAAEAEGVFGETVCRLRPDVVMDLICYMPESVRMLVEALRGSAKQLICCGTTWVYGHSTVVPTSEDQERKPFGDYGVRKAAIEAYLLDEARRGGLPTTVLHPGHITGPGWEPLNPVGNKDPRIFAQLFRGEEVLLPNFGMETVHHVHADDVAQAFMLAMSHRHVAIGESFHVVAAAAMTLRGFAEAVAGWAGKRANLRFLSWDEWKQTVSEQDAARTWDVINHSPNCSIAKARRRLGYAPRYSGLQAVKESVDWLVEHGVIEGTRE